MSTASYKRRRTKASITSAGAPPVSVWMLPAEILLEIAARSDATTLVRLSAACRLLRREILTLDFVSRVCNAPAGLVPTRLHSYLNKTFCLLPLPLPLPEEEDHGDRPTTTPDNKKKQPASNVVGFVSRSSWSWEALCTRRQDHEADVQDDSWRRQALKTLYINSHICV